MPTSMHQLNARANVNDVHTSFSILMLEGSVSGFSYAFICINGPANGVTACWKTQAQAVNNLYSNLLCCWKTAGIEK